MHTYLCLILSSNNLFKFKGFRFNPPTTKMKLSKEKLSKLFGKLKPFLAMVFLQAGFAVMDIISKAAMNQGMSNFVFVVYRHVSATIITAPIAFVAEKNIRPKMTLTVFGKLCLLGLLDPVICQNLYFLGMKYTTATFAAALSNVLPAITFLMAWLFRMEKVKLTKMRSQAKMVGTLATVAGAMIMTLVHGPNLNLPWTKPEAAKAEPHGRLSLEQSIKGALMTYRYT
ncbi:WAT1-related protein At2g37460-like [Andrographis paniculata]|uniref:WAT1-related protein At2g37460-like n=1 Tax=Andrographis paniculata TaxID=175694 RepID=UPI0021E82A87|nr:WAT1-related protein At2g37460-like [Andrographis paniculata]